MFKRFFSLFLVFALFTVTAQASTHSGLKAAYDELNYALTVEWDQKDQAFYEKQLNTFKTEIEKLQAQGLSNAELVDFVKSQVKDARTAQNIEAAFNMIEINQMNPSEASNFMIETMRKSYSEGASWSGAGVVVGVFVAVFVIAAAVAAGVIVYNGPKCGYSTTHCGVTCSGFDCDANYCCWN